jgi:replicative DNA helicase
MESQRKQEYQKPTPARIVNLERGKLPPQALDLEIAILGGLLIDRRADEMFEVFTNPDVFYKDAHKHIFKAMLSLSAKNEPIDLATVGAEMKLLGTLELAGGAFYLIELSQMISSSAHIEHHARIVLQMYMKREAIKYCSEIIEMAYDDMVDVFEMMDRADYSFTGLGDMVTRGQKTPVWSELLDTVVKNVEVLTAHGDKILGITTGFWKLDAHFGGWVKKRIYIIGARPGAGKTAFTVKAMVAAAQAGHSVGYLSYEMSGVQLATRGVGITSNFHMSQLTTDGFEKDSYFHTLIEVVADLKKLPIHIDDASFLSVVEMRRKVKQMKKKYGIELLFFDYLQLAAGGDKDVRYKLNELCFVLQAIAKEEDIAIIPLSQLGRDVDKRSPPRPRISDLSESSAIEFVADVVGFLYRPGQYNLEPEYEPVGKLVPGENTEFIIAKNRHGGVGTLGLWFEANKTKFSDEEPERNEPEYIPPAVKPAMPNEAFDTPDNWSIKDESNNGIDF